MKKLIDCSIMPSDEITYVLNGAGCQAAIDDIEGGMDTLKWLGEYLEL